jgi:hypothetical protein
MRSTLTTFENSNFKGKFAELEACDLNPEHEMKARAPGEKNMQAEERKSKGTHSAWYMARAK